MKNTLRLALLAVIVSTGNPSWAATITTSWNPVTMSVDGTPATDLAGYRIFHFGSSLLNMTTAQAMANASVIKTNVPGTGTTYIMNNLASNTLYFFRVTAYDTSGNQSAFNRDASGNNVEVSTRTPAAPIVDTQAPTVPAGLNAQVASSSQINLTWNASTDNTGVTGYRIFRAGTQIATSVGTSYSNTGLSASTAYSYTVAAYDAADNVSGQSSAANATTQATAGAVGTVSNLSAAALGANGVSLSMTEVNDGTGQPAKYDIRFSSIGALWGGAPSVTQGTCASPLAGAQIGATKTCTVLGLTPSTDYLFQLVAFRGTMNVDAVFGTLSNVASATTSAAADVMPPAKPKNLLLK